MIDRVKDPVCRMEIRLDQAVEAALFEGERVYFCSPSCYAAFLDTPHRYRGGRVTAAACAPRGPTFPGGGRWPRAVRHRKGEETKTATVGRAAQGPATVP